MRAWQCQKAALIGMQNNAVTEDRRKDFPPQDQPSSGVPVIIGRVAGYAAGPGEFGTDDSEIPCVRCAYLFQLIWKVAKDRGGLRG